MDNNIKKRISEFVSDPGAVVSFVIGVSGCLVVVASLFKVVVDHCC
ncbi:hypothetical protein IKH83_01370 [Candidatus Saccharibacteria bacterium]|nr:hypothetical protein [Candidatus Saccharibacteria bacterium]